MMRVIFTPNGMWLTGNSLNLKLADTLHELALMPAELERLRKENEELKQQVGWTCTNENCAGQSLAAKSRANKA